MTIATDFEIQADKDIRYIGTAHGVAGAGYYTVKDFHRWLQGLADDASIAGDDNLDITKDTPSERSTDNIITLINSYNIDQDASEHLYDGSIIQTAGADIWDGLVVIANEGMDLQIVQDGAIVVDPFWNSIPDGETTKGLNRDAANGISHRFMIKVRTTGADLDGRRLLCQTREWGKTYSEFKINGTARGNNVAALSYAADLNNATLIATIAAMTDIVNTEGYRSLDVDNDTVNEYYYSEWDKAAHSINDLYERMKWLTRTGSASTVYGLTGALFRGITHEVPVHGQGTSDFSAVEEVTWSGGSGQLLAVDDVNAASVLYIQLLKGVAPTNTQVITGTTSTAYADVNGSVVEHALSFPFCGVSTGSALIGAYGFCLQVLDLSENDQMTALDGNVYSAPNYVTFRVGGLVDGEDYVLVTKNDGAGGIDYDQFTIDGELLGGTVTTVTVHEAIPADTPAAGTIRILRESGKYTRHEYSAFNSGAKTFTITSHDFSSDHAADGANVFVSYIDDLVTGTDYLEFTSIYVAGLSLFYRVRDGGATPIKTFQSTAAFGASDMTVTAIRNTDE